MALRNETTAQVQEQETQPWETTGDQAAVEQTPAQATEAIAAPAVQPQAATAVAVNLAIGQVCILQQMKDLFTRMGKEWSWKTYTGVNVAGGAIKTSAKASLGNRIKVRVLNWEYQWMSHCGLAQPTDESKELVRYSRDGVHLEKDSNITCADWVQSLKEDGYPNARTDKRAVILGVLVDSERKVEGVRYVAISLSPSSLNNWLAFVEQRNLDIQFAGEIDDPMKQVVEMSVESVTNKQKQDYSVFSFNMAEPA
jgi:hypothetical protein